jgi:hypothetical protein
VQRDVFAQKLMKKIPLSPHSPFFVVAYNMLNSKYTTAVLGIVSTMGSFRERTTDGRSKLDASRR